MHLGSALSAGDSGARLQAATERPVQQTYVLNSLLFFFFLHMLLPVVFGVRCASCRRAGLTVLHKVRKHIHTPVAHNGPFPVSCLPGAQELVRMDR